MSPFGGASVSPTDRRHRAVSLPRELAEAVLLAVLLALFVRTFLLQAFAIPSGSMEPGLLVGDHLLVNKFVYGEIAGEALVPGLPRRAARRGDVVVFRYPPDPRRDFIKRCVAVGGDHLELHAGALSVNGRLIDERAYVAAGGELEPTPTLRLVVPRGHLFVLGDHRDASNDSRSFGPVPTAALKGRALLVYWSAGANYREAGGPSAVGWRVGPLRWLEATRWGRLFTVVR